MEWLSSFLVYNLFASVLGGLWALALVFAAMRVFGISHAVTRNQLMTIPLIKSTVVLLGLCTVMPFPGETWRSFQANAIDFGTIAPVFFLLLGQRSRHAPMPAPRAPYREVARSRREP